MSGVEWMLLLSQLPSSPSSTRVVVWRRMRAAGAISIHSGVWVLPFSPKYQSLMDEIASYVNSHEGNAHVFIVKAPCPLDDAKLFEAFNKNIEQDYAEFIDKCGDFVKEIETDIRQRNFTFAELDENEAEFQKLTSWQRKILGRDIFGSGKAQDASNAMEGCRVVLRAFARAVYENEGISVPENEIEYKDE